MFDIGRLRIDGRTLVVTATERGDGDVHPLRAGADVLEARQRAVTGEPWVMIDQVHGIDVVSALAATAWQPVVGRGDVLVATRPDRPVAVWAADCAPIVLVATSGEIAAVHAGWRGLAAGVIDAAVAAMHTTGTADLQAVLGPCIRSCCYEFEPPQLAEVAQGIGVPAAQLAATTRSGRPALDMATAVTSAFERLGITVDVDGSCTGCDDRFYSHRTRGDRGRHAVVARFEEAA